MDRCYHCQLNFEVDLQSKKIGENGNKWQFWVKLEQLKRWIDMDKEALDTISLLSDIPRKLVKELSINDVSNIIG